MKIKTVKIGLTYTKNLGNFENVKFSEEVEVELNEDIEKIRTVLYANIKGSIRDQIKEVKVNKKT